MFLLVGSVEWVGGKEDVLGDCAGVGGRQSKGPGGANGRFGGLGEEFKRQDGGHNGELRKSRGVG